MEIDRPDAEKEVLNVVFPVEHEMTEAEWVKFRDKSLFYTDLSINVQNLRKNMTEFGDIRDTNPTFDQF